MPFIEAATVQTRGAAGWEHFVIDGVDFLAVANFFTSAPGRQPSMTTDSAVYTATTDGVRLQLTEVQRFRTTGAHGVAHLESGGQHYLAVPNYYGGDAVILLWDTAARRFTELQRVKCDGGGGVEAMDVGGRPMLAFAEFNLGIAALYVLDEERFHIWQRVPAPGCGAIAQMLVPTADGGQKLLMLAASYVTRQTGWRTGSTIFALNDAGSAFEKHSEVATVGAHDVEVVSIHGRHFAFYSNDKDERSTKQDSELFEWVGLFPNGRLVSRQKVATDGAHAAEFFSSADGKSHFLAVANLGDRQANMYRRDSVVYAFNPLAEEGTPMLTPLQKLPTLGATDFLGFSIGGVTYLAVSNEQDDTRGGDGERANAILRIRPALTEEEGQDNQALQCDRGNRLVWTLGEQDEAEMGDLVPRQYAFDEVLEMHVGQAEVFDIVGMQPVQAAINGNVGCVLCFGASGSGKDFSLRCERPGQEGILLRALALIFQGSASLVAPSPRVTSLLAASMLREDDYKAQKSTGADVHVAYLLLTPDQTVHDLIGCTELNIHPGALDDVEQSGHAAICQDAKWTKATTKEEVMRILSKADSARTEALPREGSHSLILLRVDAGVVIFGSLASIDAMRGAPGEEAANEPLANSIEAAGKCLEALSRSKKATPPVHESTLTTILAPALGGPGASPEGVTTILVCVHPSKRKLALTQQALAFGQLAIAAVTRTKASASVDYQALASQLMAQRDAKQEALHELEGKVLRQLRPQLEEVMRQEVEIKQLAQALAQTQWEARTFASKESQLQNQLEMLRQEHAQRMYSLRAERTAIMAELQSEMSSVKGGREFAQQRQQHAEDVQAIGMRLRSLQSYVETAEAELSLHEENSTKARAVLPGAARELATLALTFSEDGQQAEAAALFAHSLSILEAAFGATQPELAAFKAEVQRVVDSGVPAQPTGGGNTRGGMRPLNRQQID